MPSEVPPSERVYSLTFDDDGSALPWLSLVAEPPRSLPFWPADGHAVVAVIYNHRERKDEAVVPCTRQAFDRLVRHITENAIRALFFSMPRSLLLEAFPTIPPDSFD